jgi:hypothetical protein
MAWYNTGNIALTNGSATVTGSGTNFLVGAQIGEALYAPDGKLYEIQTINSATVITLASNYLGSTASGQGYQIIPTQSLVADLASDVTDLISDFADVRDYAGNGKFNDGAVGTPGITFTQDQDNGLYRIGSNNWALAAGGIKQVDLSATDVEINYAGVKKLATTATGIDVTGLVTAGGATFSGNVGVQSSTFGSSDITAETTAATGTGYSRVILKTTDREWRLINDASTVGSPFLLFDATAGLERMRIDSSGNVGIGTSSPATTLHITKDGNQSAVLDVYEAQQVSHDTIAYTRWVQNASGIANIMGVDSAAGILGTSSNHALVIRTNNTERMRIDSNGNVGIGGASQGANLHILDSSGGSLWLSDTGTRTFGIQASGSNLVFRDESAATERMRIDASGNLLVGCTALNAQRGFAVQEGPATNVQIMHNYQEASGTTYAQFLYATGAIGSITQSGTTAVLYNTSSDQRLKENIADADDAGSKIDAIQVRKYDWKADGSHQDYGMIAQELQVVAPEAVSGDPDSDEMMGVDYSKLVPMMLKEIQSLRARINTLEGN